MGEGSGRIFNFIAILFLLLTIVVLVLGISRLLGPGPERPALVVPTPMSLPTLTPSPTIPPADLTQTAVLATSAALEARENATATAIAVAAVMTATAEALTDTPTPTLVPSDTVTPTASHTPTPTETPRPTSTSTPAGSPTPTATPTATQSPFPFTLRGNQIAFTSNFANTAGCQWEGLGGNVFGLNGAPLAGVRVHVFDGEALDQTAISGSNTLYGQAGWEIQVANRINAETYFVELQAPDGAIVSPTVQVTFPGSCEGNLAVVNFEQQRPY